VTSLRKPTAAAGTAIFLIVAPGFAAGLAPWWLTGWRAGTPELVPLEVAGGALVAAQTAARRRQGSTKTASPFWTV